MRTIFMRTLALIAALLLFASCLGEETHITADNAGTILGEGVSEFAKTPARLSGKALFADKDSICSKQEWKVLALTNEARLSMGYPVLTAFAGAQSASGVRAEEISEYFAHVRPNGTSCFSAFSEAGVSYSGAGENIAAGYDSPSSVVTGWLNSPGHRANIMEPVFTHMGVGYYKTSSGYRHHWVQMFCSWYAEETLSVYLEGADDLTAKRGDRISDMGIILHEENSFYGDCICPLTDDMCTGYDPEKMGLQTVTAHFRDMTVTFDVNVVDPVTDVNLNKTKASLRLGKTLQLTAELLPKTAPIRTLTWTSSDEKVATVDENGLVTSVGRGKCTITARAHSGVKASCNIEVTVKKITSIKLDRTTYSVTLKKGDALGDTFTLSAAIKPKSASIKKLKWKSSDKKVATVDENGNVTITGFGKCTITAKATDGSKKSAKCTVTVRQKMVTSLKVTGEKKMRAGETQLLTAVVKPKKAFDTSLRWKSSDPAVLTVDENGLVTAVSPGKATVTCTAPGGKKIKFRFKITVSK